jgi:hypothetical protein
MSRGGGACTETNANVRSLFREKTKAPIEGRGFQWGGGGRDAPASSSRRRNIRFGSLSRERSTPDPDIPIIQQQSFGREWMLCPAELTT